MCMYKVNKNLPDKHTKYHHQGGRPMLLEIEFCANKKDWGMIISLGQVWSCGEIAEMLSASLKSLLIKPALCGGEIYIAQPLINKFNPVFKSSAFICWCL